MYTLAMPTSEKNAMTTPRQSSSSSRYPVPASATTVTQWLKQYSQVKM